MGRGKRNLEFGLRKEEEGKGRRKKKGGRWMEEEVIRIKKGGRELG
jgi:hypothetical protein